MTAIRPSRRLTLVWGERDPPGLSASVPGMKMSPIVRSSEAAWTRESGPRKSPRGTLVASGGVVASVLVPKFAALGGVPQIESDQPLAGGMTGQVLMRTSDSGH